jgi:hypothetical protein
MKQLFAVCDFLAALDFSFTTAVPANGSCFGVVGLRAQRSAFFPSFREKVKLRDT